MARPIKQGLDYFPHDTDSVNDEKIEALRMLFGNDGYAFYFILLERIYRTANFELDVSDAETILILSKKINVSDDVFKQMLACAIKRGCFDAEIYEKSGILTSNGIKKRAQNVVSRRVSGSRGFCGVSVAETTQETSAKVRKVNKSKVNKSKVNIEINKEKFGEFGNVFLTDEEYSKLGMTAGVMIERLSAYKASTGKKYKSDYATLLNWMRKDGDKKTVTPQERIMGL